MSPRYVCIMISKSLEIVGCISNSSVPHARYLTFIIELAQLLEWGGCVCVCLEILFTSKIAVGLIL